MSSKKYVGDKTWQQLARRNKGQPFLNETTIYSFSIELVDALKQVFPNFFSLGQEQFERDLARTASFGFFHRCAMGSSTEESKIDPKSGGSTHDLNKKADENVKQMMREDLVSSGCKEYEINEYFKEQANAGVSIQERQRAYTGWLILNPSYQKDIALLHKTWSSYVVSVKRFPSMPRWFSAIQRDQSQYDQSFVSDCLALYAKWGLDRLYTWDWPDPMQPNLNVPILDESSEISTAGVRVFLPWYLLRGGKFNLQQVVKGSTFFHAGDHLRDWLYAKPSDKNRMGDIRYRRIEYLYHYYSLVLQQRYREQCKANKAKLDDVFGSLLRCDSESIRKLRQTLDKVHSAEK